jgi:hypothetical protein
LEFVASMSLNDIAMALLSSIRNGKYTLPYGFLYGPEHFVTCCTAGGLPPVLLHYTCTSSKIELLHDMRPLRGNKDMGWPIAKDPKVPLGALTIHLARQHSYRIWCQGEMSAILSDRTTSILV